LETRGAKIEQRVYSDFVLADWTLNTLSKEWTNCNKNLTIKLERNDTQQATTLKEKLVHYYISNQLPSEDAIHKQLDDLVAGRNAMQNLLRKDTDWLKQQKLAEIKKVRLENIYAYYEDPEVQIDQV